LTLFFESLQDLCQKKRQRRREREREERELLPSEMMETKIDQNGKDGVWIFGYGSLMWRPSFPCLQQKSAFIRGWHRRFYQGSTDHRGVPGFPGRVVTLIPHTEDEHCRDENECVCWGMAYYISHQDREKVLDYLDYREKGGYERTFVSLYSRGESQPFVANVSLATLPLNVWGYR